jgi:photosynthetic reaction center cytochrome c subunit
MIVQGNRQGTGPVVFAVGVLASVILLSVLGACGSGAGTGGGTAEQAAASFDTAEGVQAIMEAAPNEPAPDDPRDPWLGEEAWELALSYREEYIELNPEPENALILDGMTGEEMWDYMEHLSGALGVSCQYCHDINSYAADPYPQKVSTRLMMTMVNDINRDYITTLPDWQGNYVGCVTCHHFQPADMLDYSAAFATMSEEERQEHMLDGFAVDTQAIDSDAAYVMEHPKTPENVDMVIWMEENWQRFMLPRMDIQPDNARQDDRQKYMTFDGLYYSVPDCYTCHQGQRVPPAAFNQADLAELPDDGMTVLPPMLRGTDTE